MRQIPQQEPRAAGVHSDGDHRRRRVRPPLACRSRSRGQRGERHRFHCKVRRLTTSSPVLHCSDDEIRVERAHADSMGERKDLAPSFKGQKRAFEARRCLKRHLPPRILRVKRVIDGSVEVRVRYPAPRRSLVTLDGMRRVQSRSSRGITYAHQPQRLANPAQCRARGSGMKGRGLIGAADHTSIAGQATHTGDNARSLCVAS